MRMNMIFAGAALLWLLAGCADRNQMGLSGISTNPGDHPLTDDLIWSQPSDVR